MNQEKKFELLCAILEYADNIAHCERFLYKGNYEWTKLHRDRADENWKTINYIINGGV